MKIPRSTFALAGLTLLAPACAPAEGADVKAPTSSFLGPDARLLTPGDVCKGQASLRYFNPAAQWQQYKSVLIEPVTFWGDETSKVAPSDQQALATYFKGALDKEFGESPDPASSGFNSRSRTPKPLEFLGVALRADLGSHMTRRRLP